MRICLFLFFISTLAYGADRALLIGVTQCVNGTWDALPGIEKDVEMMRQVCGKLGITEVKVLTGGEATRANILKWVERWLIQGVDPNDRALLYFSGHGYYLPDNDGDEARDERNHLNDEVLIPADTVWQDKPVRNYIRDDEVFAILRRIPTNKTWLMVDACHSGTVYRGLGDSNGWVAKNLIGKTSRPITRSVKSLERGFGAKEKMNTRFISLTAAKDHEEAIATRKGSLFTRGVHDTVMNVSGRSLTFQQLKEQTRGFIVRKARDRPSHTPVLAGDENAFNHNMFPAPTQSKPKWSWLEWGSEGAGYALKITSNKRTFNIGEELELMVKDVPDDGYLNVLSVDSHDEVTVLYPNRWESKSEVYAGETVRIPGNNASYHIPAVEPAGKTMILAIHTRQPLNLFLDDPDSADSFFRQLRRDGVSKALRMLADEEPLKRGRGYGAADLEVNIH